jgi:hypothetical protein
VTSGTMGRRHLAAALAALLVAVAAGATAIQSARAASVGCNPRCVILIQVDGLEPKDVTAANTPVLWALGHGVSSSVTDINPLGNVPVPGVSGRSGFTWQAGRGAMTAGTATATASLLTGGYSEQSGVPADDYQVGGEERWLGMPSGIPGNDLQHDTVLKQVTADEDKKVGVFLGDPGLFGLATNGFGPDEVPTGGTVVSNDTGAYWVPSNQQGVPAYCAPPRDLEQGFDPQTVVCPAPDAETLENALTGMTTSGAAPGMQMAFIHLAELGAIKRLYGDIDASSTDASREEQTIPAVQDALHATDAAIGEFIGRYSQDSNAGQVKWPQTILFVVGDHGYEETPLPQRVPDPLDPAGDLTDYVKVVGGDSATLIPQGTIGTIYYSGSHKATSLKAIRDKLLDPATGPNSAPACAQTGGCIEDVLYVRDTGDGHTVAEAHPSWHLDHPAIASAGDLVVVTKPGWALGRSVPTVTADGDVQVNEVANPFEASSGGPRNRAIFALVNGPGGSSAPVRSVSPSDPGDGRYPVARTAEDPEACPTPDAVSALSSDVNAVNRNPGDDANSPGHECQPEVVDFAPTMAALMKVSLPDTGLAGRFLQEAFVDPLGFPKAEELPPPDPQPEPAAPAVEIYIPPPPPPPPPPPDFFSGLVRDLKARVVDAQGCAWPLARRGTAMDYLLVEGDFGKKLSAVTLTFYTRNVRATAKRRPAKRPAKAARSFASASKCPRGKGSRARAARRVSASRTRLKAIARFKPFTVERGHVVLKLKVPDQFQPTHVGITVQEANALARAHKSDKGAASFIGIGPKAGGIYSIADAKRLHDRKGRKARTGRNAGKRLRAHRGRR